MRPGRETGARVPRADVLELAEADAEPATPALRPAGAPAAEPWPGDTIEYAEREAWEFVHFLGAHLTSLETRAAIIVPAQLAGLIALWTQLYTFEEALPRTLAWIAWAALGLGLVGAGWLIVPGRLRPGTVVGYGLAARPGSLREVVVREVCEIVQGRIRRLHSGLRLSAALTLGAFGMVVVAYAVDKSLYGG